MSPSDLWRFFPLGYLFTILIETPILLARTFTKTFNQAKTDSRCVADGLHLSNRRPGHAAHIRQHLARDLSGSRRNFRARGRVHLFWLAYGKSEEFGKRSMWQDFATIVVANLASFMGGEILNAYGWFGLLG